MLPVWSEDGNGLLVVANNDALDAAPPIGLEVDKLANAKLQHGMVSACLTYETESLNNAIVEIDKLLLTQAINVDGHASSVD